jgi:hypothetical protein
VTGAWNVWPGVNERAGVWWMVGWYVGADRITGADLTAGAACTVGALVCM